MGCPSRLRRFVTSSYGNPAPPPLPSPTVPSVAFASSPLASPARLPAPDPLPAAAAAAAGPEPESAPAAIALPSSPVRAGRCAVAFATAATAAAASARCSPRRMYLFRGAAPPALVLAAAAASEGLALVVARELLARCFSRSMVPWQRVQPCCRCTDSSHVAANGSCVEPPFSCKMAQTVLCYWDELLCRWPKSWDPGPGSLSLLRSLQESHDVSGAHSGCTQWVRRPIRPQAGAKRTRTTLQQRAPHSRPLDLQLCLLGHGTLCHATSSVQWSLGEFAWKN